MAKPYAIFDPKIQGPLHEASREAALIAYEWFIAEKGNRTSELENALSADGIKLSWDEAGVVAVNNWFWLVAEKSAEQGNVMPGLVYSLANDIGIFVGELLMRTHQHLQWAFYTKDSKGLSYQRPVIVGFKNVSNKDYYLDPDYLFVAYGLRIFARNEQNRSFISKIYKDHLRRA